MISLLADWKVCRVNAVGGVHAVLGQRYVRQAQKNTLRSLLLRRVLIVMR